MGNLSGPFFIKFELTLGIIIITIIIIIIIILTQYREL